MSVTRSAHPGRPPATCTATAHGTTDLSCILADCICRTKVRMALVSLPLSLKGPLALHASPPLCSLTADPTPKLSEQESESAGKRTDAAIVHSSHWRPGTGHAHARQPPRRKGGGGGERAPDQRMFEKAGPICLERKAPIQSARWRFLPCSSLGAAQAVGVPQKHSRTPTQAGVLGSHALPAGGMLTVTTDDDIQSPRQRPESVVIRCNENENE